MSGTGDQAKLGPIELETGIAYLQKPFTAEARSRRVRKVIDGERSTAG